MLKKISLLFLVLSISSCGVFKPKYSKPSTYDEKARKVLIEFSPLLQDCYIKELERSSRKIKGSVTFKINIAQTGKVELVKLIDDTLRNKRIKGCFVKTIHKIPFPKHDNVESVQLNQPFKFRYPKNKK
ncbi:MAG: hypothetical protein ACJAT2_002089 [Bacteriovoracaceae bacterium]|jgi:hypothetical protein